MKTGWELDNYLIVVPVYNGLRHLDPFRASVPKSVRDKLLFVDDGSRDGTGEYLRQSGVEFIAHEYNRGKGAAITSGILRAKSREIAGIVTLDVDLQHPPQMLEAFMTGPEDEIRLGDRVQRSGMGLLRKLSNFFTSLLVTVRAGQVIRDSQCGYRSLPVKLFREINITESGFQFESEVLIKGSLAGYRIRPVKIPTIYGDESSAIQYGKDTIRFIWMWLRSYLWT